MLITGDWGGVSQMLTLLTNGFGGVCNMLTIADSEGGGVTQLQTITVKYGFRFPDLVCAYCWVVTVV